MAAGKRLRENGRQKMAAGKWAAKRPTANGRRVGRQGTQDRKLPTQKKLERRHAGKQTITGYLRDNGEGA